MHVTELSGSRFDIGHTHARLHRQAIIDSIDVYDRMFHDMVGLHWHEARLDAERFLPMIEQRFPEILEEMAGLAQGIGGELLDILTLNCRSEISLTRASGGCSAVSILQREAQWLAQNWDWRADQGRHLVALRIRGDDTPALISIGEAGMVAKIGLNECGIGVALNAIRSATCGDGLPIHVALRRILESRSFSAAEAVVNAGVCAPAHFLIADGQGHSLGCEVHSGSPGRLEPRDGVVTHTNHLISDAATHWLDDYPKPDSWTRLERLNELVEQLPRDHALDPERLFAMLGDHSEGRESLCRHFDPSEPETERMETLFSVAMNLTSRELWLRFGKPCSTQRSVRLTPIQV
ncbi:C45 family autoproteolytic acyltransferase/hydolase [Halomonas binhaiensis]|uniref:Peptidase C45 acyl-coenzyme A--6-aminopenicillanic acid acyl-transferase n=1 Tax=Halomonas binhaiensis TaxID=2562282 RepID=A0A5C1NLA4_9GAMM|nr:C45 family peptidase [Halomonas binhaiensis]QEM83580.1 peptidase C45 acyl-coenzyme A--6- aminopenicillanic acid acyl-transferase [Halomonas binhaiensis]